MLRKNKIVKSDSKYLYTGMFDTNEKNKIVNIQLEENLIIDLNIAVTSTKEAVQKLTIKEIQLICSSERIKAIIYPTGNISFRKLDSSNDELKSCYLSIFESKGKDYIVCIAFDETQPALYKAELLGIYTRD